MRIGFLIIGLALAVLLIGAWQWWSSSERDELEVVPVETGEQPPTPPTPSSQTAATPAPLPEELVAEEVVVEPEIELPPLNESDDFVRVTLQPLELPADWLEPNDLARRLAVVVDNTARGEVPRRQLSFLAPSTPFKVIEYDDGIYLDPANYRRFDGYVDMLVAVDPATAAGTIETMAPLLREALGELGNQLPVAEQIRVAIDQILAVPVRRDQIELVQPKVVYEFAEPRLEAMSPLQKQMLRMGPDNLERVQTYLQQVRPLL